MQCTNCGKQVSESAKVCGYCGHRLKDIPPAAPTAPPASTQSGLPGWAWALIGSLLGLVIVGLLAFIFILKPAFNTPATPVYVPPQVILPPTEKVSTPAVRALPSPTATATQKPPTRTPTRTPTKSNQRCDLFQGIAFKIIWLDIPNGSTMAKLYVKMPGGVPGLETTVPGDREPWEYKIKIGDYYTVGCGVIQGYKERLYCEYPMPSGYANSVRPLELYVNGCNMPVYQDGYAELPAILEASKKGGGGGGSGGCSVNLGPSACAAAGGTYINSFCTNPPCPEWCSCP